MKLADVVFAAILMNMLSSQASAGATCENLASLSLPDTTITVAQTVAAGALIVEHSRIGKLQIFHAIVPHIFASAQELIRAIDHQNRVETCHLVSHEHHRYTFVVAPTGSVWQYNHLQPG